MLFALAVVLAAGIANGVLVAILGLNPIVATLGTNTLLTAVVFAVSDGIPRSTTDRMAEIADGRTLGIPNAVYFAVAPIITTTLVKSTVFGRHFEAIGANPLAMWTTGCTGPRHAGAYVWAQLHYWLGGMLLAGIVTQPTAFQGKRLPAALRGGGGARRHVAGRRRATSWPPSSPRCSSPNCSRSSSPSASASPTARSSKRRRSPSASPSTPSTGGPARRPDENPSEPLAGPVQPSVS